MSTSDLSRRRYDGSSRRRHAALNRDRILQEARRLFVEQGFTGTTVAQIATAAGVTAPTVFANFSSKVGLLKRALETAIAGDDEEIPLADRPALRHVREGQTAQDVLRRFAAATSEIAVRTLPIYLTAVVAADSQPEIAAMVSDLERQRLRSAAAIAELAGNRAGVTDADRIGSLRDTIWLLTSARQLQLVVDHLGWSVDHYQGWLTDALLTLAGRLLSADPEGVERPGPNTRGDSPPSRDQPAGGLQ